MSARPTIDVVVATTGRTDELRALLASLARQDPAPARVVVVDQNPDDRLADVVAGAPEPLRLVHVRSAPGLSRARNVGLQHVTADVVAFPDDDCTYPDGLLARVADELFDGSGLAAVTGRTVDSSGRASERWPSQRKRVTLDHVWHAGNSASTFVRHDALARVGGFDERLGLGSGTPWSSGEDTDLLIRLLRSGARIEHDPAIVVTHPLRELSGDALVAVGARDGAAVGYLLRKHGFGSRLVARMLVRPAVGAVVAVLVRDRTTARFRLATLRGRLRGYRAAGRAAASG